MIEIVRDLDGRECILDTASWQLSASYMNASQVVFESRIIAILSAMSQRRVSIGVTRFYFYAYFDEEKDVRKAEQMMKILFNGEIFVRPGSFNVSNLVL